MDCATSAPALVSPHGSSCTSTYRMRLLTRTAKLKKTIPKLDTTSPSPRVRTLPNLVAVERSPSTIRLLAPPRHHVHHPLRLVSRAKAGPLPLKPVAGLAFAVRGRAAAASHVDHDGRFVKRAELCLLSLFSVQAGIQQHRNKLRTFHWCDKTRKKQRRF